jgi:hypothetical protein
VDAIAELEGILHKLEISSRVGLPNEDCHQLIVSPGADIKGGQDMTHVSSDN